MDLIRDVECQLVGQRDFLRDGGRSDDLLMEREVSLRLLRHIASSVRHQQFHDTDIVTVRVDAPAPPRDGG